MSGQPVQVFHATAAARRAISRRAYLAFAAGAGALVCSAIFLASLFATESPDNTLAGIGGAVACVGAGGLVVGLVTLGQLQKAIAVEVSPYRLIWREGRRAATLEFTEVERVDLVRGTEQARNGMTRSFPVVRFVEEGGEMMEFEASFDDRGLIHRARFDARAITAAVLPHLSSGVRVSRAVREFAQTGQVDIDELPER